MLIYLACPYSHLNPEVVEARYHFVTKVAGAMMGKGQVIFSPITHSHVVAREWTLPTDWEFWREQDLEILKRCDAVAVLKLPGWQESIGVRAEIDAAIMNGIPVLYVELSDLPESLRESYPDPENFLNANPTIC